MNETNDTRIEVTEDRVSEVIDERRSYAWDFKNAVSNYAFMVLSQGGIIGLSFLNFWIITKFLGAEGYGSVIALITMSQMVQPLALWTNIVLLRLGVEEYVKSGLLSETFWNRSAIMAANIGVLLLGSPVWLSLVGNSMKISSDLYIYALTHLVIAIISNHFLFSLQAVKLIRLQSLLQIVERIVILIAVLLTIYAANLNIRTTFLIYTCAPLVTIVIASFNVFPFIKRCVYFNWAVMKKLMIFSLPFAPLTLIGFLGTNYFDSMFISYYLTKKDVGIYSTAYQLAGIASNFLVLANSLLLPMFITLQAQNKANTVSIYLERVLPLIVLGWSFYCCLVSYGAQYIFPLVFGKEFVDAGPLATIIITSAVIGSSAFTGYVPFLLSRSLNNKNLQMGIVSAGTNALFNSILVPRYGLIGCAIATVLSSTAFVLFSMYVCLSEQKKSLEYVRNVIFATIFGSFCTFLSGTTVWGVLISLVFTLLILYIKRDTVKNLREVISNARS